MTKWNSSTQKDVTPATKAEPIELAFGVVRDPVNRLFCVKMIKYQGNKVLDSKTSNGTTMGHAITDAEDMLAHYHLYRAEDNTEDLFAFTAEKFFETARMI